MNAMLPTVMILAAAAHAAEISVEPKPLRLEKSLTAVLLPKEPVLLKIDPEGTPDLVIESILPHGTLVKKGQVVVAFERKPVEQKIDDARRALETQTLALATQELAFSKLKRETEIKLEAYRRAAQQAADDLAYFQKTGRKAEEDQIKDRLEGSRQRLAGEQEELVQLKKMYDADDVTEETEEIILKRQQYSVESATLDLRIAELNTKRTLEVTIPRRLESMITAEETARIALEKAEKDLPRDLQQAEIALQGARIALGRTKEQLADLEKDAAYLEIKAPVEGRLYYGSMDEGRWQLGELAKSLVPGGRTGFKRPFATIVPAAAERELVCHVDEATVRLLEPEQKALAQVAGLESVSLPAEIEELAPIPGADGRYRVDFSFTAPEKGPAATKWVPGMTAELKLVIFDEEEVLSLPRKALETTADGKWTVEVKLADGKTERRPVTLGRSAGDEIEVLEGLEAGQVVVLPD